MRAPWFAAGFLSAAVLWSVLDVTGDSPADAARVSLDDRTVEALADAAVALDARLERIEFGCYWLPERDRSVGVSRVKRRPVPAARASGADGPGDWTGTRGTGPRGAGRQTDE